jgi:hypothetical protein
VNISYLAVIDQGLKHAPTYQVLLQCQDNIRALDIIKRVALLLKHTVYGLGDNDLGLSRNDELLLGGAITTKLTASLLHNGDSSS